MVLQSLNTSSGEAASESGSINYSVGQVFQAILESPDYKVIHGVQFATDIGESQTEPELQIMAYPNPMMDYVIFSVDNFENQDLAYQFLDMQGRVLKKAPIEKSATRISQTFTGKGFYILNITTGNKLLKSIKLITK